MCQEWLRGTFWSSHFLFQIMTQCIPSAHNAKICLLRKHRWNYNPGSKLSAHFTQCSVLGHTHLGASFCRNCHKKCTAQCHGLEAQNMLKLEEEGVLFSSHLDLPSPWKPTARSMHSSSLSNMLDLRNRTVWNSCSDQKDKLYSFTSVSKLPVLSFMEPKCLWTKGRRLKMQGVPSSLLVQTWCLQD